jgi:hypothetical protein
MIPLRGHTRGHAGVAIRTGEGWRLRALSRERAAEVRLFCSHDAVELEALQRLAA